MVSLNITLTPNRSVSLQRQLSEALRQLILTGQLLPGQRVPSTRELAQALQIARNTAIESYDQLKSEGYLETQTGAGTFVCRNLPEDLLYPAQLSASQSPTIPRPSRPLSTYGCTLAQLDLFESVIPGTAINFRYARPALDQVPLKQWTSLWAKHACRADPSTLDYAPNSYGYLPLREAIARYLARSRSVRCDPEQIIIVNGSLQAANIVTRVLLDPGELVAIENPGFRDIRCMFQAQKLEMLPVSVDRDGLVVEELLAHPAAAAVKLLYVTPSHQSPLGVVLSLTRRLKLLDWARETGAIILEEDFDSEFRYGGRPIPALQGLDRHDSVIYIKDFHESLFPALRLGYLIAPRSLIEPFARAKWLSDRQTPMLEQKVMTDFINEGYLEQHIRRMQSIYQTRRRTLVTALQEAFADRVEILGEPVGMHLTARFQTALDTEKVISEAARLNIGISSTQRFYISDHHPSEWMFGYSALNETEIKEGINRLSQIVNL